MGEHWRPICRFEGKYDVSSHGRIKSLARMCRTRGRGQRDVPERILKLGVTKRGRLIAGLSDGKTTKSYEVSRIVAKAFIYGDPALEVNHIDGDPTNNMVANLEWVTRQENIQHAYDNNLMKNRQRPITAINPQTGARIGFPSIAEACRRMPGTCSSAIAATIKGKRSHHKGFRWQLKEQS